MKHKTKIAIDTVFFNRSYSGITRVWETILQNIGVNININKNINSNDNDNDNDNIKGDIKGDMCYEIILLIRDKIPDNLIKFQNIYQTIVINDFNYMVMHQDVDHLNFICKQHNIEYFISTYYTYCTVIPNILMIYDMIPELFHLQYNHMWQQKDLAIKNASQFITISNTTKNDLLKYYPYIKTENYLISLIYIAVPQIIQKSLDKVQYDDNFFNTIMIANGIYPKKYIFAMATNNEKYKNIELIQKLSNQTYLVQLSQLFNTNIPIILLIKKQLPNGYAIYNGILYLSNITDEILNTLYKNALCFINPSLYEGFGLPVFEAFAHKTAVIANYQPIFEELCNGNSNAINYIKNDVDELFEKICFIHKNIDKPCHIVNKRIENGIVILSNYTEQRQNNAINTLFNSFPHKDNIKDIKPFLNIIFQSYNEIDIERRKELEYCILANLDNPYIKYIHDFGYQPSKYLPNTITQHYKYISIIHTGDKNMETWLTYKTAFEYSNLPINVKYGIYWGIINCDIFLNNKSQWHLMRGQLNNGYVFAQSRHEFNILSNGTSIAKMDDNFAKLHHANTQDGWFYKTPIHINNGNGNGNGNGNAGDNIDFHLGMLGCDNAIADRLIKSNYQVINQPETYKLMHYDVSKGKNSTNYLEKHTTETQNKNKNINNTKPKNKHPEQFGSYLVPNYDQFLGSDGDIDLNSVINSICGIGGLSNQEKYKIITDMYSSRLIIANPM